MTRLPAIALVFCFSCSEQDMHSTLRNCLFRLVIVVGVAIGATLVIVTTTRSSPQAFLARGHDCWLPRLWRSSPVKRNLQGIGQAPTFHEMNQGWPRLEDRRDSYEHYSHRHHGDDNDYSEDENDDDDDSESSSQSSSGLEAAVQSSVISNMDGVNIGNTITIVNIGTGSEASASEPGDNFPRVKTSGSFSISEKGRSAVTSAAVRAFCDSMGCNPFPSKVVPSMESRSRSPALSTMSSVIGRNGARGNEAQSQRNSDGQTAKFSSWLLLIAILIHLNTIW